MHILMIGAGKNPSTFIRRHIQIMQKNGVKISLFPEFFAEFEKHKFVNTLLCRNGFVFHLPKRILDAIKQADIIHYQWPGHFLNYYALAKKLGKPSVLSFRGRQITILPHVPGQEKYVKQLKKFIPLCHAYHCISDYIFQESKKYGVDPERTWIIKPAVDTSFFKPPKSRPSIFPLRIVTVGAIIWRKGCEYALLALKQLIDQELDVELLVVGDGKEYDRLTYTIKDLGLSKNVIITGQLPAEGVRKAMQDSHIFLHTSLSEGFGNVAIEAMACGLPVVAADSAVVEAFTDGVEGFKVPLRNVDMLAYKLRRLIQNPDLRSKIGKNARRRAVHEFDLKKQGRKFLEMYQSVIRQ